MTAYRPSPKLLEVLAYLREREIAGWADGYTSVSVEKRGISTTRAESHRLSEPRLDLLIPGLTGVSSFEESAE